MASKPRKNRPPEVPPHEPLNRRTGPRESIFGGEREAPIEGHVVSAPPAKKTPRPPAPRSAPTSSAPRRTPAKRTPGKATAAAAGAGAGAAIASSGASKPSVTGGALRGAGAGAGTGAVLGQAVGGPVGAAAGAAGGAAVGGVTGAVSGAREKKAMRVAGQPWRKLLVAEFAVCIVIAALGPMTGKHADEHPSRWMKQMAAIMGLFFVLGLIASASRGAARFSVGVGGLVALGLAITEREVFTTVTKIFQAPRENQTGTGPGSVRA